MPDRVSAWLENMGLGIYREAFEKNAITWDVLPELNQGDLESLGVLLGHRKILLRAIAQLPPRADVTGPGSLPSAVSPSTPPFPPERDQAERRQLTVMFCDLVDSTALSRRVDPEDLQDIIRRFLDGCTQAIGRFNGYIAKYMGDGMLVYFGYPHAYENDAERAVYAGLAILDTVKGLHSRKSPSGVCHCCTNRDGDRSGRRRRTHGAGHRQGTVGVRRNPESCRPPPSSGTTQSVDH